MKKVSVITVCFNSQATLRETIESVINQNYPNIEYIIIDGGSQDGTLQIVEDYSSFIKVSISEPDNGIYDAMNKGIKRSSGDIIAILNSDDMFTDHFVVSDMVNWIEENDVDAVYADLEIVKRENPFQRIRYYSSKGFRVSRIRWGWMLPHPTFFVKKGCYEKHGLYKVDYRVAADFELLARFLWKKKITAIRMPRAIVKMRTGGISSHGIWWRFHQNLEIVRACKENGIYTNIFFILMKFPFKLLEYTHQII